MMLSLPACDSLLEIVASLIVIVYHITPKICLMQLDIKTKLCIRDSLYRLAKSAEQRHNNNANGCIGDNEACKAMMVQDASRYRSLSLLQTYIFLHYKV